MLEAELQLVGRQTPTAGGPLDLLGVDAGGRLVVYELKRGTLTRDAVTQCIDYGSWLATQSTADLSQHIANHSGHGGIEEIPDFEEWYQSQFGEFDALLPPRLVLVGLRIDKPAERMAQFLSDRGVDLSVLTFYGFKHGGETLLARQVESSAASPKTANPSIAERFKKLDAWLSECELTDLFNTVCEAVRSNLSNSFENPTARGISFQLQVVGSSGVRGPRTYFSILAGHGGERSVTISFGVAALRQNEDAFRVLEEQLSLKDWPHGHVKRAVYISSPEAWETQRNAVLQFVEATVKAWHGYRNTPQTMA